MSIGNCGTPVRGSGKNLTVWKLEWTYSGATGEVTLDAAQSDAADWSVGYQSGGTAGTPVVTAVWLTVDFQPPP